MSVILVVQVYWAEETEFAFDMEIVRRAIDDENYLGTPGDYEYAPLTTVHQDFDEALWFAAVVATHEYKELNKIVCFDLLGWYS